MDIEIETIHIHASLFCAFKKIDFFCVAASLFLSKLVSIHVMFKLLAERMCCTCVRLKGTNLPYPEYAICYTSIPI